MRRPCSARQCEAHRDVLAAPGITCAGKMLEGEDRVFFVYGMKALEGGCVVRRRWLLFGVEDNNGTQRSGEGMANGER